MTEDVEPSVGAPSRRFRVWWLGLALCVVPAAGLAACGLTDGVDDVSSEQATATPTAPPSDPAEPDAATSTSPEPAATEPAATEPVATDAVTPAGITFTGDIEPIITSTCANCHTGSGPGTQHIRMDTAGFVARASAGITKVTSTGFMPPWPASDESVEFDHDWSLTDEQVAILADWDAAGSPLDVADDHTIAPSPDATARLSEPDVVMRSQGSYDGTAGQPDEYRCLIYDPEFAEAGYITAMDFIPEQEQVVHHAVGFLVRADDRAAVESLDAVDEQGGWSCFGFSPARSAQLIYAWAPGQSATRYGEGAGLAVEPGDFWVMQTHYHFDVEAPPDRSTFTLDFVAAADTDDLVAVDVQVFTGPAEIPCSDDETGPLCERSAALALAIERYGPTGAISNAILGGCGQSPDDYAGMTGGVASSSCDLQVGRTGEIISVFGHEHELGASFRMILSPDTADETVLLDIPVWDFDWQLNYEPADSIIVERGDTVRLECSWDRSLRDPALEPAYVLWADGTDDEMCFATIVTRPLR